MRRTPTACAQIPPLRAPHLYRWALTPLTVVVVAAGVPLTHTWGRWAGHEQMRLLSSAEFRRRLPQIGSLRAAVRAWFQPGPGSGDPQQALLIGAVDLAHTYPLCHPHVTSFRARSCGYSRRRVVAQVVMRLRLESGQVSAVEGTPETVLDPEPMGELLE